MIWRKIKMIRKGVSVSEANQIKKDCTVNGGKLTVMGLSKKYGVSVDTIMNVIHNKRKYGRAPYVEMQEEEKQTDLCDAVILAQLEKLLLSEYICLDGRWSCRGISTVLLVELMSECFQKEILPEITNYPRLRDIDKLAIKHWVLGWPDIQDPRICEYKKDITKGRGLCMYSNKMTSLLCRIRFTDKFIELYRSKGSYDLRQSNEPL
jgi:hypothetical protein